MASSAPQLQVGLQVPFPPASYSQPCPGPYNQGGTWSYEQCTYENYLDEQHLVNDIKDNLGADYIRLSWNPDEERNLFNNGACTGAAEPWKTQATYFCFEDRILKTACTHNLNVFMLTPTIPNDSQGENDLLYGPFGIKAFFDQFAPEYPKCIIGAEVVNEANVPSNGFNGQASQYAPFYLLAAQIISTDNIKIVTSGVTGQNTNYATFATNLGNILRSDRVSTPVPLSGFGFHPYLPIGSPADMATYIQQMINNYGPWGDQLCTTPDDPGGTCVYALEWGSSNATLLGYGIEGANYQSPVFTVCCYKQAGNDTSGLYLKLKDNTATQDYFAFQTAAQYVHTH